MACDVRQVDTAMEQFATAESEWENVTEITAQFKEEGEGEITGLSAAPAMTALVTVEEVVEYLKTHGDMEQFLSQVKSGGRRSGVRKFFSCLLGPPSLPPHLRQSVRQVQATALISFSNEEAIHLAMLRTIYRQLTCTTLDCPRYGAHWEEIGFQGSDPSTDLRGVGILGLVQALFLVVTPEILPFSQDLYKLSRKEGQEFPLLVLSLNMTRITVQAVRDGILNRQLAAEEDVWRTVNFFYCSLLHQVYTNWRQRNLTIRDCGPLIQQTEQLARTRAGNLVSQFEKFLTTQYTVGVKQAARQQIEKYSSTRTEQIVMTTTAEWEEKINNPDPRIKWAMDVMDHEGQDFEGALGRMWAPMSFAALPLAMNFARNASGRMPLRTNLVPTLLTLPFFGAIGYYARKWNEGNKMQEEAVMRHYIITHPELFPEPKKVKYIDHIEPWRPVRW